MTRISPQTDSLERASLSHCSLSECSCLDPEGSVMHTKDSFLLFSPQSAGETSHESSTSLIVFSPSWSAPPNCSEQFHHSVASNLDESVVVVSPSMSHSAESGVFMSPIPTVNPVYVFTPPEVAQLPGPQHSTPVMAVNADTQPYKYPKRRRLNSQFFDEQPFSTTFSQSSQLSAVETSSSKCCGKECLCCIETSIQDKVRVIFQSKSIMQQNQFLLDSFNISSHCGTGHTIEGNTVCTEAFIKILGISKKRYRRVYGQYSNGATISVMKKRDRQRSTRTSEAKAWMTHFFNNIGDHMPHTQQIHLPHFLTKIDVYTRMKRELGERGIPESDIISRSHFYALWECDFKKVVIPERSLFSKCDLCTMYAQERSKPGYSRIPEFESQYSSHLKLVEEERKKYYQHREKSRSNPEKYITIIIDGMDQNKTNIPSLLRQAKSSQNLQRLRTHLSGALVHTRSPHGKQIYAFYDLLQWPHDCNLVIEVLCQIFLDLRGHIPPVLYLQMDNCGRENKNQYFMAFCTLLVEKKIFKKVRLNFLPVGHTHEDVDQFFSKVSQRLKKNGAESMKGLMQETALSTTPTPKVALLERVINFKEWITPHMDTLHGHSSPHCFKFLQCADKRVRMFYKNWSSDAWTKEEEAVTILKELPTGCPQLVCPSTHKIDLPRLLADLPKYKPWLSVEAWTEWEKFLHNQYTCLEEDIQLDLQPEQWFITDFNDEDTIRSELIDQTTTEQNQELATMFSEERRSCSVYTGAYQPQNRPTRSIVCANLSELKEGQLVAVHCDNCSQEPLIGRIEKAKEEDIEIIWLEGGYTKAWKVAKTQDINNKRKKIEWRDTLPRSSVILFDFKLTSTNHLRKATVVHLKKVYEQLKQGDSIS